MGLYPEEYGVLSLFPLLQTLHVPSYGISTHTTADIQQLSEMTASSVVSIITGQGSGSERAWYKNIMEGSWQVLLSYAQRSPRLKLLTAPFPSSQPWLELPESICEEMLEYGMLLS
jgi:hypothetical protein